jgi:hypothetical protein
MRSYPILGDRNMRFQNTLNNLHFVREGPSSPGTDYGQMTYIT